MGLECCEKCLHGFTLREELVLGKYILPLPLTCMGLVFHITPILLASVDAIVKMRKHRMHADLIPPRPGPFVRHSRVVSSVMGHQHNISANSVPLWCYSSINLVLSVLRINSTITVLKHASIQIHSILQCSLFGKEPFYTRVITEVTKYIKNIPCIYIAELKILLSSNLQAIRWSWLSS